MTTELILALVRANLAASVLILAVFAARQPVRRLFGARLAYGLWLAPPLGALAALMPSRVERVIIDAPVAVAAPVSPVFEASSPALIAAEAAAVPFDVNPGLALAALWLVGIAVSLALLARRQNRFLREARLGRAGPAVCGVLLPRVVIPADFQDRYSPREQAVVIAHEQTHLRRHDVRVIAVALMLRALNWFNPLVHLAVRQLRIDQELACDAEVLARYPGSRRTYADAMLKTQLTPAALLPLGCHWPSAGKHPLAERISLLSAPGPSRRRTLAGAALIAGTVLAGGVAAWAAQPARVDVVTRPAVRQPTPAAAPALALTPVSSNAAARAPAPAAKALENDPRYVAAVTPGRTIVITATSRTPSGKVITTERTFRSVDPNPNRGVETGEGLAEGYRLMTCFGSIGDKIWVEAVVTNGKRDSGFAKIELADGEQRVFRLPDGTPVTVKARYVEQAAEAAPRGEPVVPAQPTPVATQVIDQAAIDRAMAQYAAAAPVRREAMEYLKLQPVADRWSGDPRWNQWAQNTGWNKWTSDAGWDDVGPRISRTLPFDGGESLTVKVPAEVRYVAGREAKVAIEGPQGVVDHIVVEKGVIKYDKTMRTRRADLRIVVTAPRLSHVTAHGAPRIDLGQLNQDHLEATLHGSGKLTLAGQVRDLNLSVHGSGLAQVNNLVADILDLGVHGTAQARVTGRAKSTDLSVFGSSGVDLQGLEIEDLSGNLGGSSWGKAAVRRFAELKLMGSSTFNLLNNPQRVESNVTGSSRLLRPDKGA